MMARSSGRSAVVRVRLLVAGIFPAGLDCLHARFESLLCLSQIMQQSGKLTVATSSEPAGEELSEFSNAGEMIRQQFIRVSEEWSRVHGFFNLQKSLPIGRTPFPRTPG